VILSGCGVYDGAEIHESVITLLRLTSAARRCSACPEHRVLHVINHLTGEEMPESRNVLVESARIARGEVKDIREANAEDFDALIVPAVWFGEESLELCRRRRRLQCTRTCWRWPKPLPKPANLVA
jgi:enhancing lycopene biosynthesis protein 2